jgi:hypothetical protein
VKLLVFMCMRMLLTMNKSYLLKQDYNSGYDTYDSCVVVAESSEEAIQISPCISRWRTNNNWAPSPKHVEVKYLGLADNSLKSGEIVCASFNAG